MKNKLDVMNMTDAELVNAWSRGNDAGDGWAPAQDGDDTQSLTDAIEAEDGTILRAIEAGSGGNNSRMYLAEISGQFCVVADCNGPWTVTL